MYGRNKDRYADQYENRYDARRSHSSSGAHYQERMVYDRDVGDPTGCLVCLKYVLIILNVIFLLAGIGVCVGSTYILVEKLFFSDIIDNQLMRASCWLIIVPSGVSVIFCICGIAGAAKNNKSLLFVYTGFITVLAVALISGGVVAVLALRPDFGERMKTSMEETLKEHYGTDLEVKYNQALTKAWDKSQDKMHCCAVRDSSWPIYRQSRWYAEQPGTQNGDRPYVPASCCKKNPAGGYLDLNKCQLNNDGPPFHEQGSPNHALHYRGCFSAAEDWVDYYSRWLLGLGFGFGFSLVLGIILSLCMAVCGRKWSSQ